MKFSEGDVVIVRYRSMLNGEEVYGDGIIEKDLGNKYEISLLRPKINAKLLVTPEEIYSIEKIIQGDRVTLKVNGEICIGIIINDRKEDLSTKYEVLIPKYKNQHYNIIWVDEKDVTLIQKLQYKK